MASDPSVFIDPALQKTPEEQKEDARSQREEVEFLFSPTDAPGTEKLLGRKLHAFSPARFILFNHIRNGLGCNLLKYSIGDSGEFFPEATRILFLCFHTKEELARLDHTPQALQNAVNDWAETHLTEEDFAEAEILALSIWNQAHSYVGIPDQDQEEGGEEEPGKPPSSFRRWLERMLPYLPASLGGVRTTSSGISPSTGSPPIS